MEIQKISYITESMLNSNKRVLVCNDDIVLHHRKVFTYVRDDERLISFAQDRTAMYSDCYILYAIAFMGVATKESISLFLQALSRKYPELAIICQKTKDSMEGRLHNLANLGYVFMYRYTIQAMGDTGEIKEQAVSLYTVVDAAFDIVRQRLQKRLSINMAIQYKPLDELIGWASAAYVGACIAQSAGFTGYLERVLRTKMLGSTYLPFELKNVVEGTSYYIAVINSFLQQNKLTQTDTDYLDYCAFKLNTIKNYLAVRTTKGVAIVCVALRDKEDLAQIGRLIYQAEILRPYLEQIFFTGEGIIRERGGDATRAFLRLVIDDYTQEGYHFEYVNPIFM